MKHLVLAATLSLSSALAAQAHEITIIGVPEVRRVVMPSLVYFGGDVELLVRVQVLNDEGKPVPETTVTLSVTTKDGGLARLRAFGITDTSGLAVVRTAFDLPVRSLEASLVPCLVEPQDECGKTLEIDLTRRNDLEVSFGYSHSLQSGTITSSLLGIPRSSTTFDVLGEATDYEVRARFVRTLLSLGTLDHNTELVGSVGGGVAVNRSHVLLAPSNNSTSVRPAAVDVALTAVVWSRVQSSFAYAPIMVDGAGYWAVSGLWEQPIAPRFRLAAGYSVYVPQTSASGEVRGRTQSPMVAVVYELPSGGNVISADFGYEKTGATIVRESSSTLRVFPAFESPSVKFSWDFHKGGYAYLTCFVQAARLSTSSPVYAFGSSLILRQWAHLR